MHSKVKHLRRQHLINATISCISKRGFSRTTLAHVAKEAGVSQGIVSFYFNTKDALLLETLTFLAVEYESAWKNGIQQVPRDPVAMLEKIIEIDLGKDVCSRKKVAVWLAFWAESPSRPKYRQLCQGLMEAYRAQTRELCEEIIRAGDYRGLDADHISRGLNALIDGYWTKLAIDPKSFDREQAKRACRAYLSAMFPAEFGPTTANSDPLENKVLLIK